MKTLTYAPDAFRVLNGFFCIYKPSGLYLNQVKKRIAANIARDLNYMEVRPPRDMVLFEGSVASGKPLSVKVKPNLADHPAVVGPRYQLEDVNISHGSYIGQRTSGVAVFAVNDACKKIKAFRAQGHLQVIEVKGKFGYATDTFWEDGKVREKATYRHMHQVHLDRTIASIQASHQAEAYTYAGVPLDSQQAYELASKGLVRPKGESPSLLYNICCTEFSPPLFTLKIHCINTTEEYLAELIHQIGIYLRSCAVCCQIRQIQFGHLLLDHALLRKHWTVEHIIANTVLCKNILGTSFLTAASPHFKPIDVASVKQALVDMQEEVRQDIMQEEQ